MQAPSSSSSDHEFFELLEQARAGNPDALGLLIDRCRPYLLKIAYDEGDSALQSKEGDSDLVQYTCLDAVASFQQFRGRTSQEMLGWLKQILLSRLGDVRDHYGAQKRDIAAEIPLPFGLEEAAPASSPSEHAVQQEEREEFERALRALPESDRTIIEMRQKHGHAFGEIARLLHLTEPAARKRWARAIQALQDEVNRRYGRPAG